MAFDFSGRQSKAEAISNTPNNGGLDLDVGNAGAGQEVGGIVHRVLRQSRWSTTKRRRVCRLYGLIIWIQCRSILFPRGY